MTGLKDLNCSIKRCLFCRSKCLDLIIVENKYQIVCNNCGSRGPLLDTTINTVIYWNLRGGLPAKEKARILIDHRNYGLNICAENLKKRVTHIDIREYKELANEVLIDHRNHEMDIAYPENAPHGTRQLVPGTKV